MNKHRQIKVSGKNCSGIRQNSETARVGILANSATKPKRGFTIAEMVVSLTILGVLGTLVAQWFAVTARQQQEFESHRVALQTAANLMEQAFALPWDELTTENAKSLANEAQAEADDCDCAVTVTDLPATAKMNSRLIEVRITRGTGRAPVVLTAWRHSAEGSP